MLSSDVSSLLLFSKFVQSLGLSSDYMIATGTLASEGRAVSSLASFWLF